MIKFFRKHRVFQKKFYNGIPKATVCRVLRKRLHLKAYKLSIVQLILKHPVD
jgi:hypothetical protein